MSTPDTALAASIKILAAAMTEARVQRVRLPGLPAGWEIELHPSAFAAPAAEPTAIPEAEPDCKCGHDLATEHNEAGCLRGCPHEACVPPMQEEP
jgi:hypothetical protein